MDAKNLRTFVLKDVKVYTMDSYQTIDGASIVVTDGVITCIAQDCKITDNRPQITLEGGIVTPGFIEVASHLGLQEILSEEITSDGISLGNNKIAAPQIRAVDGIRTMSNHKMIRKAYRAGVLSSITSPLGTAIISGVSVGFHTSNQPTIIDRLLFKEEVGFHIQIGSESKVGGTIVSSISGQLNELRSILKNKKEPVIDRVLSGELPLIAYAHSADDIMHLLRLKQMEKIPSMVVVGGAEAHLLADNLAKANISVVLTPWQSLHAPKEQWDTINADIFDFGVPKLHTAGVKIGLAMGNVHNVAHLRWLAGHVSKEYAISGLTTEESLACITSNLADMFGLSQQNVGRIKANTLANFVIFDGNPLTFSGRVRMIVSRGVLDVDVE